MVDKVGHRHIRENTSFLQACSFGGAGVTYSKRLSPLRSWVRFSLAHSQVKISRVKLLDFGPSLFKRVRTYQALKSFMKC